MDKIKLCIKCSQLKSFELFSAGKNRCKVCISNYRKEYHLKNSETLKQKARAYHHSNREIIKIKQKHRFQYLKINEPEKLAERQAKNRKVSSKAIKLISKKWRDSNKAKIKSSSSDYYKRNKQAVLVKRQNYKVDQVSNLTKVYIKEKLKRQELPVTTETIDLKRNIILIKRINKNHGKSKEKIHRSAEQ